MAAATNSATERAQKIQTVIEAIYGKGGIDRILNYGLKGEDVVGQFEASGQKFNFTIFDNGEVEYQPVSARGDSTAFALGECVTIAERMGIPTKNVSPVYLQGYLSDLRHDTKAPKAGQQTAADKSGRVKTCTAGKTFPCGGACFPNGKACKKSPGVETKAVAQDVKKQLKEATKPKSKDLEEKPKSESSPDSSLGSASKFKQGEPIKDYKSFAKDVKKVISTLDEEFQHDNVVPIHQVREALGDRVSKDDFDKYMKKMSAPGSGYAMDEGDGELPEEQEKKSVVTDFGVKRYIVNAKKFK